MMFTDIIIPEDNEKKFMKIALKLDLKSICFVYKTQDFEEKNNEIFDYDGEIKIFKGLLLSNAELSKTRKLRKKLKPDIILTNESSRKAFSSQVDIIFEVENQKKDFLRFINSGFDFVKAQLAKKNYSMLGFSFSQILNSGVFNRVNLFSRLIQNATICRKKKVDAVIASFAREPYEMRAYHELFSFGAILKMESKQLKESLENTYKRIIFNEKLNSGKIIERGVEILTEEEIKNLLEKHKRTEKH